MKQYFALLDGEEGGYGVAFPDLPGCTAMGRTLDEARRNAIEAMADWSMDMGGPDAIPKPSDLAALREMNDVKLGIAEGAALIAIPLLIETGSSVRANVSMDRGVLAAIDAAAAERGLTRSSFLTSAAIEKIRAGDRV